MIRIVLLCAFLLLAIGVSGMLFYQWSYQSQRGAAGGEDLVNASSENGDSGDPPVTVQAARIDRVVVAGIVLPATTGLLLLVVAALGKRIDRSGSWLYVGALAAFPALLMLVLSLERVSDLVTAATFYQRVPLLQLLLGTLLTAGLSIVLMINGWASVSHGDGDSASAAS